MQYLWPWQQQWQPCFPRERALVLSLETHVQTICQVGNTFALRFYPERGLQRQQTETTNSIKCAYQYAANNPSFDAADFIISTSKSAPQKTPSLGLA
eukprot:scaffold8123_cov18-Tisochrysis_lutea.AAC.1